MLGTQAGFDASRSLTGTYQPYWAEFVLAVVAEPRTVGKCKVVPAGVTDR